MSDKIIDQLSKQWEEFKETNDARLDEIQTRGDATSETLEKLEKVEKAHDLALENRKRLEAIEANAKILQRSEDGASDVDLKHRDAWYAAMACLKTSEHWLDRQQAMFDARKDVTLTTTGGGNAIPTLVAGVISEKIIDISPMRKHALVVQGENMLTRYLVTDNNSTSTWVAAGSARSQTTEPLIQSAVPSYGTVYGYTYVYEEALNDLIINVPGWLENDIANRIAQSEGIAFVRGTGADQPDGVTTSGTPVALTDTGSPERDFGSCEYLPTGISDDFQKDRLGSPQGHPGDVFLDVIHALRGPYHGKAVWMMNMTTMGSIRKFKDAQGDYLYRPNFQGGMGDLFGYQVVVDTAYASVSTNAFPVAFGDFSEGYIIADLLGSMKVTVDDNITAPGFIKFYSRRRLGGTVTNDDAIKLIKCSVS